MATRSRDCRKASSPRPRRIPRRSPGSSRRSDICTASSSTPRSPTHRGARTSCATSSRASPASSRGRPPTSSRPPWPRSATASIGMLATRPPTGRSSVHCRAGSTRPSRRLCIGRSAMADLHLCRPWAHAEESELLRQTFEQNLGMRLVMVDARERFLARLAGVEDPEEKRRIIGDEFIQVFEEEAAGSAGSTSSRRARSTPTSSSARPPRPRPPRRSRPTTTSGAAGRPAVPADRAAALPVQGRGPQGRLGARAARGDGAASAVPRTRPRDPDHRGDRGTPGHVARGRLDRHRRDQGGEPVSQPVAELRSSRRSARSA